MMQIPSYSTEFEIEFCEHVLSGMKEKQKQEIVDFCNSFFPVQYRLTKIEDLILMRFDTINLLIKKMDKGKKKIKCNIRPILRDKNGDKLYNKKGKVRYGKNTADRIYERYNSHIVKENKSKKLNVQLVKSSGILVCPYCNRNYINVRDTKMGGQLDHFYSRSSYPFLAISLYNLVPSCSVCNNIKRAVDLNISPFEMVNPFNDVKFEYFFKSETEIDLLIKCGNEYRKQDIAILKLKDAYSIHDVDVLRMLNNEKKYNRDYRSKLKDRLKMDDLEIDKIIFGEVVEAGNLANIPLGKLKSDIYETIKSTRLLY